MLNLRYAKNSMKEFVIHALVASKIAESYIFANLAMPGLERRAWQRYASDMIKRKNAKAGILVIRRAARAHICGLVSYRCDLELLTGRVLQVRHLAAIDMLDSVLILSALLDQLTGLAQRSHCSSICITLSDTERDRSELYDTLLQLRPSLVLKRRFGIEWDFHQRTTPADLS